MAKGKRKRKSIENQSTDENNVNEEPTRRRSKRRSSVINYYMDDDINEIRRKLMEKRGLLIVAEMELKRFYKSNLTLVEIPEFDSNNKKYLEAEKEFLESKVRFYKQTLAKYEEAVGSIVTEGSEIIRRLLQ